MADERNEEPEVTKASTPKGKKEKAISAPKTESMIYVGPNLAGRLSRFTVFRDGIPAYLADLIAGRPDINQLIVPVAQLGSAQAAVNSPGTIEYRAYQNLNGGA